ncbi:CDP-alcohol phosphatidyltransferase family protein [Mobilicoccus massiliensis]|uniref:CDP-alcohol phosphatidyltransferase family protein n=1 Tax=Mobilicoccus massiliensis TaxID=1522310 RepID=UPI000A8C3A26|nr:CDP-alcohol phosphatidyltransferase family protein [Mobilicoccus massiliensis]
MASGRARGDAASDLPGSPADVEYPNEEHPAGYDRVWTIPNILSMVRLAGLPVFLWLIVDGRLGWAVVVLVISSVTDFLDGVLARRLHQITRLGQSLDPVADRLYILCTLFGLWFVGALPWWFLVALLLRDVAGSILVARVRREGYRGLPVHDLGKAGTFSLLASFPILLLAYRLPGGAVDTTALAAGWAFAWWGLGLYWISLAYYVRQTRDLTRTT